GTEDQMARAVVAGGDDGQIGLPDDGRDDERSHEIAVTAGRLMPPPAAGAARAEAVHFVDVDTIREVDQRMVRGGERRSGKDRIDEAQGHQETGDALHAVPLS